MDFNHIKGLYGKGQYQELLDLLDQMDRQNQFSSLVITERIECLYYKSLSQQRLGRFKEALDTALQARDSFSQLENKSLILALLVMQTYALIAMGQLKEALEVGAKGDIIHDSLTDEEQASTPGTQWIAAFLHVKGILSGRKGDFSTALKYYQRSLALRGSIGTSQGIAETLRQIGGIYWSKGELKLALEHLQRSLSVSESMGNPYDTARTTNHLGLVYHDRGELNSALEHYQRSLELFEHHIGNPLSIAVCLLNIGRIYRDRDELDVALDHFERSLTLLESVGDPERIATAVANIGSVYWRRGELDLAEEHLGRSLAIRESIGTDLFRSHHLFYLLRVALEQKDQSKAQAYASQLEAFHKRSPNKIVHVHSRLGEALVLKSSPRFINKAQAQKILTEIVEEEEIVQFYGEVAMIHLCELLLDELKAYGSADVFQEAKNLVQRLYTQAEKEHSFSLVVNTLILQAKFAMVEGDLIQSATLLEKAKVTAEEKGLGLYAEKVSFEAYQLEEQVDSWQQLIQSNAPLQERLEQAHLDEYLKAAMKLVSIEK